MRKKCAENAKISAPRSIYFFFFFSFHFHFKKEIAQSSFIYFALARMKQMKCRTKAIGDKMLKQQKSLTFQLSWHSKNWPFSNWIKKMKFNKKCERSKLKIQKKKKYTFKESKVMNTDFLILHSYSRDLFIDLKCWLPFCLFLDTLKSNMADPIHEENVDVISTRLKYSWITGVLYILLTDREKRGFLRFWLENRNFFFISQSQQSLFPLI